jgi:hypothetical protein
MRGLPPLPTDIITLEVEWVVGDGGCTTSWHLFNGGSSTADPRDLALFFADWFFICADELLALVGVDCSIGTCRVSVEGSNPLVYETIPSTNQGAIGSTNPLNGALCLTWRTNVKGASSRGHSFLPLATTLVDSDHKKLKAISWAQAVSGANNFIAEMNSLAAVDGGLCVFAIVSRSRYGKPLPFATWAPVLQGGASQYVATLQRRVRSRRPTPSL